MADPPAPEDIARHSFEVVRRGYEQQDVRAYLHEVSSLVERLQRSEQDLRERLKRAESRLEATERPDEASMLAVLGEETTRVLTSAREAAAEIRSKAEANAERLIADATREAAEARSGAQEAAEQAAAAARAEAEVILEQARTELARRTGEAEEAAAKIRDEGAAQAAALRDEGERDRADARAEAEVILEAARAEGRSMVAEAQAVRERVLRDLAVRRKKARLQVEKLHAGRERLLQAYEVVRRTIDEATGELTVSLTDARLAADAAARRLESEPEPTLAQLDEEVANAGLIDLPIAGVDTSGDTLHEDDSPGPFSGEVPVVTAEPVTEPAAPGEHPSEGHGPEARADEVSSLVGEVRILAETAVEAPKPTVTAPATTQPEPEPSSTGTADGADDVFARLRAETAADEPAAAAETPSSPPEGAAAGTAIEPDAPGDDEGGDDGDAAVETAGPTIDAVDSPSEGEGPDAAEPDDRAPFAARDEALAPVAKELGRRLKRALADEQNEVLDLLRRAKPATVDDLLPGVDDHAARWADTAATSLTKAATAGATSLGGAPSSITDLADELARGLVNPLRERIDRSFAASDGNLDDVADRVRALYREWKGQRLAETTGHYADAAYAWGVFDALTVGAPVQWVVDPATAPCPDCDDNVLAGALAKGEEFPTGGPCAPAHPGCRCLVLPA